MIENLELVSDVVTVNIKHFFSADELARESQLLAQTVQDKATTENNKKVAMSGFSNQIKQLDAEIKVHSDCVANGFTYKDVTSELYRDYDRKKRVYLLKGTETIIKEEDFRESDYQKQLPFDGEDTELTQIDRARQQQIEENNRVGGFAAGDLDALDEVIIDKKVGKGKKGEKPTPKNNLGDHYNKNEEFESELPDDDDLLKPIE